MFPLPPDAFPKLYAESPCSRKCAVSAILWASDGIMLRAAPTQSSIHVAVCKIYRFC